MNQRLMLFLFGLKTLPSQDQVWDEDAVEPTHRWCLFSRAAWDVEASELG